MPQAKKYQRNRSNLIKKCQNSTKFGKPSMWRKKQNKQLIKRRFLNSSIELLNNSSLLNMLKPADEGIMACTWLVEIKWNDGTQTRAYLKAFPLDRSLGVLNEITGYILAKKSGLPMSNRAGLILMPDGLFPNMDELYSYAFVTSEVPGKSPSSIYKLPDVPTKKQWAPVIELLRDWKYLPNCLAFDDWTANTDRHCGNVIFSGHGKVYMIDHSNLPVGIDWNSSELIDDHEYENKLAKIINYAEKSELYQKVEVSSAATSHPDYYKLAYNDLKHWWDILLHGDKDRRISLERFIKNRASSGHQRICASLQILEV